MPDPVVNPAKAPDPVIDPAKPEAFDRGKLSPVLRDMKPEEITELFETMATQLRTPAPAAREPTPAPKPAPVINKDELKELLDPTSEKFDPEAAFTKMAEKNYGKLFGDINARSIRGLFPGFRGELPDFQEYEADISEALKGRDPRSITEVDVLQTYFQVKGMKHTVKEKALAKSKATETHQPTPKVKEGEEEVTLSAAEEAVARTMFKKSADPIKDYKKFAREMEGGPVMKVPVGGGKSE